MQTFSDPEKEYVYRCFTEYFDDMTVEKVRDDDRYSIYMARMPCLLLSEMRYVVVMVPKDGFPPSYRKKLSELRWVSLQTRTLTTEYPGMIQQNYQVKRDGVYESRIRLESRTKEISVYSMDKLPLQVSLLHVRNHEFEYPNEGSLLSALETFRTIVHLTR